MWNCQRAGSSGKNGNIGRDFEEMMIAKKMEFAEKDFQEEFAKRKPQTSADVGKLMNTFKENIEAIGREHDEKKFVKELVRKVPTRMSADSYASYCHKVGRTPDAMQLGALKEVDAEEKAKSKSK